MCGIVGYVGDKQAAPILMDGLKRLEYRGYDSAGLAVRPIRPLEVALNYNLATGRYMRIGGAETYKMNNINELNLTAAYNLNDTFGVYAKLGNILCQKYELYYGYPMQGFNAMIGVNINF